MLHLSKSVIVQVVKYTDNNNDDKDPDAGLSRLNGTL